MGACTSKRQASAPSVGVGAAGATTTTKAVGGAAGVKDATKMHAPWQLGSGMEVRQEANTEKRRVPKNAQLPARLGVACRSGLKQECPQPNQDSWGALYVPGKAEAFGVFDGHGVKGHLVSHFTKEALLSQVEKASTTAEDLVAGVCGLYGRVQRIVRTSPGLKPAHSGTTVTVVVHDIERERLVVSHLGDSKAVLFKRGADGRLVAEALTEDHVPQLPKERERIARRGGYVYFDGLCHRVTCKGSSSALNMSRSLGDVVAHDRCGVSAEPDVTVRPLHQDDVAVLVASDGIWEVMTPKEAAEIVATFLPFEMEDAAKKLADEAIRRWYLSSSGQYIDDVTVVLAALPEVELRAPSSPGSTVPPASSQAVSVYTSEGSCATSRGLAARAD